MSGPRIQLGYAHETSDPTELTPAHWLITLVTFRLSAGATTFALMASSSFVNVRFRSGGAAATDAAIFYSAYAGALASLAMLWAIGTARVMLWWNIVIVAAVSVAFAVARV